MEDTASLSNRLMVSRAGTVSNPTASNRVMVNNPTANNRATVPPSMEVILSRDTGAVTDLPRAHMAVDTSRLLPKKVVLVPAEERRWVWEEACWAAC